MHVSTTCSYNGSFVCHALVVLSLAKLSSCLPLLQIHQQAMVVWVFGSMLGSLLQQLSFC